MIDKGSEDLRLTLTGSLSFLQVDAIDTVKAVDEEDQDEYEGDLIWSFNNWLLCLKREMLYL
jgi:hypothetical protein